MQDQNRIPANVTHQTSVEQRAAANEGRYSGNRSGAAPRPAFNGEQRKPFVAKGHDAQLQDAQFSKKRVRITNLAGEHVFGTISKRDKFTITLRHENPIEDVPNVEEIFYKHGIESVIVFPAAE